MKFRKRPVVIEAEQWFPGVSIEGVLSSAWPIDPEACPTGQCSPGLGGDRPFYYIKTLEQGTMHVCPGDWIITGVMQEKYPCKDQIFRLTYEPMRITDEYEVPEMTCETHPGTPWPHEDCPGPGMPWSALTASEDCVRERAARAPARARRQLAQLQFH